VSAHALLSAAAETLFGRAGQAAWLTKTNNTRSEVKALVTVPNAGELDGQAPIKLDPRFIELAASTGAATGDLVTVSGTTWTISGEPEPDTMGLSRRWIGVPFGVKPVVSFSYHASGYPLVTYTAGAWAAS
jgi:hypothetical protein